MSSAAWRSSPASTAQPQTIVTPALAERLSLASREEIVIARQAVRRHAVALAFSLVDQTKVVTAASELARNVVQHAGGGHMTIEIVGDGARQGLRLTFEDQGPGIRDIERVLRGGYSTGGGLGLGLSGSKRLSNEFAIESTVGQGTKVVITRWR
jgi:serine/threonine-protein kinase RsbT